MGTLREALSEAFDTASTTEAASDGATVEASAELPSGSERASENAVGEAASGDPKEPVREAQQGREKESPGDSGRARDETGKFAKAVTTATKAPKATTPTVTDTPKATTQTATDAPPAAVTTPTYKAPATWSPSAREAWGKVPSDVQAEITRREHESRTAIREAGETKKQFGAMKDSLAPFEMGLRARGQDPMKVLPELLQIDSVLYNGPLPHKAQVLANVIKASGVPLELLNQHLDGQAAPAQAMQPQQFRDPRFDQFLAQQQEAEKARNVAQIQEFAASHEFFDDVREAMGGLMDAGLSKTLEQAYAKAIALNDDVQKVVKQREAAKSATASQANVAKAKVAASSIHGKPAAPTPGDGKPKGLRAQLEEAYDARR